VHPVRTPTASIASDAVAGVTRRALEAIERLDEQCATRRYNAAMHRRDLLHKLDRYAPSDAVEIVSRARVIEFVNDQPRCFERSLPVGHITGSGWLIDESRGRVLLTHHRKLDKWLQLGGHCDGDPDVLAVAVREAREESGIDGIEPVSADIFDLDVHSIPARGDEPAHHHYDIRFLLRLTGAATFAVSDESHDLAWLTPADIMGMDVGRSIRRMCEKWTRQMRQTGQSQARP